MKKLFAVLMCVVLLAGLATGCGDSGSSDNEIVIAVADEFNCIDPMETTAETNQIVQDCTHDLLTDTNLDTMQNEGELVDTWEMIDLKTWKFTLKDNVTFHDGTILNVDDVIFTFDRAADHATTSSYAAKIEEIEKVDDLTFICHLVNGDVDFNYTFAANSLAVLSKEAFETMDEEEAVKIGTGPWMYEDFVAGDYVSLVPFEGSTLYEVPTVDRLVFKMIPEAATRMIALENGEVDLIMSPATTDYTRLEETDGLQLITETGRTQHFICFNLQNPDSIVTDPTFRLAVACGIDKDEMIQVAWDGWAIKSTSMMCRDMEFYTDLEGIAYDPEKAAQLFEECGAVGKTISLVTSDADHRVKLAENFQAQMKEYGIDIAVEYMQNAALTELNTGDHTTSGVEISIASWTPGKNADYMFRNPIHSTGGRNYAGVNDPEIDALIDAAAAETDEAKRQEMYTELQEIITYDVIAWVPIAQHTIVAGAAEGIEGAKLHPGLVHQFKEIHYATAE
ncbi:MAG: ABC transporter substrate-binding protein [Firmicutes bacterium]|nr:ABC transporter substrate-binding protein [Bacillota bacterium]